MYNVYYTNRDWHRGHQWEIVPEVVNIVPEAAG